MQSIYRRRLINLIETAIAEYREAKAFDDHRGLQGRVREIAVRNLIRPLLPAIATRRGRLQRDE